MLVKLLQKGILKILVPVFENSYLELKFSGSETEFCWQGTAI